MSERKKVEDVWSSKEISHDAPDNDGIRAEVNLIKGYSNIKDIKKNDKAWQVHFFSRHDKAFPAGWFPVRNNDKFKEIVLDAYENDTPIYYRIEQRRRTKNNNTNKVIARDVPIIELTNLPGNNTANMELTNSNTVRSLVGLSYDNETWFYDENIAVTNPKEDKQSNFAEDNGIHSAFNMEVKNTEKPTANYSNYNKNNDYEPKVWETLDSHGNLNPGSLAVSVPLNIYSFVVSENNKLADEDKLDADAIDLVAKVLLKISNNVQLTIHDGLEKPNLGFSTHTRARAIVFSLVQNEMGFTNSMVLSEWAKKLQERSIHLWKWSLDIVSKFI